jgi:hypothetical protein
MGPTPLSSDTSPDAEALQFALWRGMTGWEKLGLLAAASRSVAALQRAGITYRTNGEDPNGPQRQIVESRLGPVMASRVHGSRVP